MFSKPVKTQIWGFFEYPKKSTQFSQNEWEARVDLAACYRLVHYYGWTSLVYNHITLRVPETQTFLINPFGLMYDEICASNLVLIDIDGNKIGDNNWPINKAGYIIASINLDPSMRSPGV